MFALRGKEVERTYELLSGYVQNDAGSSERSDDDAASTRFGIIAPFLEAMRMAGFDAAQMPADRNGCHF